MRLRIDELAHRAGTTSRNVRAYQARGLLPPPELEGRTGFYGQEHLERLRLIGDLQERGFSLEAIRHTLDAWARGGDLADLLGFEYLVSAPLSDETPARYTLEELTGRFPEIADDPALADRALQLGLLTEAEDGVLEAPSPMLIEAGTELVRIGVPLSVVLDLSETVRSNVGAIADRFLEVVTDHLVRPILEGDPDARATDEVVASLSRLRPIALEVVRPFLAQEMRAAIDRTMQEQAERLGGDTAPPDAAAG